MRRLFFVSLGVAALAALGACRTDRLTSAGYNVAISPSAPIDSGWDPRSCRSLGYIVGRGGGAFGGGWISNENLIEYAMNDLRNQAAEMGANFIQHDSPTMGQAGSEGSTTTTATVSGTAYLCARKAEAPAPAAVAPAPPPASAPAARPRACTPGTTQACVGPGACKGGQFCLDDGSKFSPCDCGENGPSVPSPG